MWQADLPCPWPDCRDGTPDTSIHADNADFDRVHWRIDDEHELYFWHKRNTPYAYDIRRAAIHELLILQGIVPSIIWHYTNIQAFKNLVESNDLWLTDIEYLNDSTEFSHGFSYLSSRLQKADYDIKSDHIEFHKILEKIFKENLDVLENMTVMPRISVVCFGMCVGGDDLTQWKGYGHGGTGVAIGFDRDAPLFWRSHIATLGRVIYDNKLKDLLADRIALYVGFAAKADMAQETSIVPKYFPNLHFMYESKLLDLLMEISVFLKDEGFNTENEARFVYNRNASNEDETADNRAVIFSDKENRFRVQGNVIISYCGTSDIRTTPAVEIRIMPPVLTPEELPIREVLIGPIASKKPLIEKGINEFLRTKRSDEVRVRTSKLPLQDN